MNQHLSNFLKFLFFLGLGAGLLWFLFSNFEVAYLEQCKLDGTAVSDCSLWDKLKSDFVSTKKFWLFMALFCFMISNISRAIRWEMLIEPLNYKTKFSNRFFAIMVGYLANLFIPRVGEVVRAGTLFKYEKVPVEKGMGTIVVDRIFDFISLGFFILLALFFESDKLVSYLSENAVIPDLTSLILYAGISFLVFVGLIFAFWGKIKQSKFFEKIKGFALGFWEGIISIKKMKRPGGFLFHSVLIWVMYLSMTYVCFFAYPPTAHLSLSVGLMVFVLGAFGIIFPSPGGMGTYHFMITGGLVLYGIDSFDGFSFANIIFFALNIFGNLMFGLVGLIALPIINKNYTPQLNEE